jgi:tRNA(Glu) U13 pseudouridine synthase TruD
MRRRNELTLLPKLPLLITESADEFDALRDAFEQEIKPQGIIEQMYVHDISSIVWEILRLRRCKVVIINSAFRGALKNLLEQFLGQANEDAFDVEDEADEDAFDVEDEAEDLAQAWFTDQEAKKQVSEILARFDLDESAIEAEAIRRSSSDLELLDRMLTSLESRRNKALGCVAEYRVSLGQQLRESADRVIDGKGVLRLEDAASNRPTAA